MVGKEEKEKSMLRYRADFFLSSNLFIYLLLIKCGPVSQVPNINSTVYHIGTRRVEKDYDPQLLKIQIFIRSNKNAAAKEIFSVRF